MDRVIFFFLIIALSISVTAEESVPPVELGKWKSWVLEKHPDIDCPRLDVQASNRRCAWPGELNIQVTRGGVSFSQSWEVYGESWLNLPGNQQHWPSNVQVNNQNTAVLEQNNLPVLHLQAGKHKVSGKLEWRERPQYLQIPSESALINVIINGETLAWPNIDNNGRLWFKRPDANAGEAKKGDSVKAEVFRRVNDGVPITMETVLRLVVSGKPRELRMGQLLLKDSEPTQFNAGLPARIEEDGSLRIQVRAGSWQVYLSSRFTGNVVELKMMQGTPDWPEQEIWSFSSTPNTRGVKISGVDALDPSQLDMPQNWNNIPTYLVEKDSTFTIEEQYRGDVAPSANQITANRIVWLDFDGSGATVKDNLSGVINQDWRLSAQTDMQLGRVSVDGQAQLVTRMDEEEGDGIEIRQQQLNLEAISRLQDKSNLSATGWQHDLDGLNMTLNLPPGWQLWHATGTDSVTHSWLSRWDLWDLFLCLLIVGATFKLLGLPWAALATLTLALSYHESHAPIATWVVLIVVLPLLQVLPQGSLRKTVSKMAYLTLFTLVIVSLLFAVQQIRRGLYPQLEQQRAINAQSYGYGRTAGIGGGAEMYDDAMMEADAHLEEMQMYDKNMSNANVAADGVVMSPQTMPAKQARKKLSQKRYQPSANTQTGPGQPTWNWNTVHLGWSGPVTADAPLKLYLSPPWFTRLLMFLQVGLIGLLVFGFGRLLIQLGKHKESSEDDTPPNGTAVASVVLLACVLLNTPTDSIAADAFPPDYLLKEWEQRLLQLPKCAPHCLAINRAQVSVSGETLHIRMRVGTGTELGIPLPYDKTWQVNRILVNDVVSESLAKANNRLWLRLPEGHNEIRIEGKISGDAVNIPFPLAPHNVSVSADDWEIFGLQDNRVPSKSLQLQKREKAVTQDALLPDPIAPFVRVNRHLNMDLDWHISTSISRIAPQQGGLSVKIPLLEGESVVTEEIKVIEENGQRYVTATFGARQSQVSWISVLKPTETITFTASNNPLFVETWSAQSSPRWHMTHEGLTPIKSNNNQQGALPRWLPWPGEQVQINIVKPEPVEGATTTVESVVINSQPGTRSTDLELQLKIRTSLGGDFRIEQPENATLERIEIDGQEMTQQQEGNTVVLPLHPGLQSAKINWLIAQGVDIRTSTPKITLSAPAGNIDLTMTLPQSRWPLLVSGPDIGPAMLYWGVLIVILCVAVALGKIIKQQKLDIPVSTWQWVLLALGMSTVNMLGSIPVVLWFFAMEARAKQKLPEKRWQFNLMQLAFVAITIVALVALFATIPQSLLSTPDMQVTGNGSYNYFYNWYQDNSKELLPQGHIISVPIWVYRVAMLAWSLWLVFALLRWAKWSWQCFSKDKLWAAKLPKTEK
ncbi:MAG: hypothetical protein ACI909_001243 [Planctomycetota bacterium]|jgi:hypothetical protein